MCVNESVDVCFLACDVQPGTPWASAKNSPNGARVLLVLEGAIFHML